MEYEEVAHMIVFGETFSGKTYYTKHLLRTLNPEKIFVFTGSPHEWIGYNTFTDSFEENATKLIEQCTEKMNEYRLQPNYIKCPFVVVFDDFNEEINTKSNELYKTLYTRGRHFGMRIINLAHSSHAIGPLARANARYIFILASTSNNELEKLAELFCNRNHYRLKQIVQNAFQQSQYNCVVIDKRTQQHAIDHATVDVDVTVPQSAGIFTNPSEVGYHGVTNPLVGAQPSVTTQIASKTANNMIDNSINNFNINHNVKMQQLIEANNIHNDIKMQNLVFQNTYKMKEDVLNVRELVYKPFKSPQEKDYITQVFNKTLTPSPPFTIMDYEEGIPMFMETYFKESYKNSSNVLEKAGNLMLCDRNDIVSVATSGWSLLTSTIDAGMQHRRKETEKYAKLLKG